MVSILTLEEAKQALRLQDDDVDRDDLLETSFLPGVTDVVEDLLGWVVPREVVVEFDQCNATTAALTSANVVSLTSGEEISTGTAVDVSTLYVDVNGILRNSRSNTALSYRPWRLTMQVGMDPIPDSIKRGTAEVLIQAWASQRQKPSEAPAAFLVPYRAAAWFSKYSTGPSVG